jgi:hypothetical protein
MALNSNKRILIGLLIATLFSLLSACKTRNDSFAITDAEMRDDYRIIQLGRHEIWGEPIRPAIEQPVPFRGFGDPE